MVLFTFRQTSNAPQYVFWYHNNRMITFDRQRGGISVTIETSPRVRSRLTITRATQEDSGNYSCTAANTVPDSITVYITQGGSQFLLTLYCLNSRFNSVAKFSPTKTEPDRISHQQRN